MIVTTAKLREKEAFTALLFCRHGDTDYPEDCFYISTTQAGSEGDPQLNEAGREQAERLGEYLAEMGEIQALYVSPVLRTLQTSEAVQTRMGKDLPVMFWPDLMERNMGSWEGRSAAQIKREDGRAWESWKTQPLTFRPPGGESLEDFCRRVSRAVTAIVEKEAGRIVAVVTHVGVIRAAVATALGMPVENGKRLTIPPGSATRIHYSRSWPNLLLFAYQP